MDGGKEFQPAGSAAPDLAHSELQDAISACWNKLIAAATLRKDQEAAPLPYVWPADRTMWTIGDCLMEECMRMLQSNDRNENYHPVHKRNGEIERGKMLHVLTLRLVENQDYLDFMRETASWPGHHSKLQLEDSLDDPIEGQHVI
jgi:hypothetical protein